MVTVLELRLGQVMDKQQNFLFAFNLKKIIIILVLYTSTDVVNYW